MAPRRASTLRGSSRAADTRSSTSGIRRNTCSRQPPSRYSHEHTQTGMQTDNSVTNSVEPKTSFKEYSHSPASHTKTLSGRPTSQDTTLLQPETQRTPSTSSTHHLSTPSSGRSINLSTMRELLRAHKEDIIDRVFVELRNKPLFQPTVSSPNSPVLHPHHSSTQPIQYCPPPGTQPALPNSTATSTIAKVGTQLAQLRTTNTPEQPQFDQRHLGTSYPTQ